MWKSSVEKAKQNSVVKFFDRIEKKLNDNLTELDNNLTELDNADKKTEIEVENEEKE